MWYEPAERLQRLDPAHTQYSAPPPLPPPHHNHDEHFVEANSQTENRVPVIHHENEQWTNVLHNDIHMTSNLTGTTRTDPQEYLTASNQAYATNPNSQQINHHQHNPNHHHQTNHMVDTTRSQNDTVIDFQTNGMNRSNDFDGLTDRSLFQTSMLNIDEVLFGLS